eukprot:CAMPEP_0172485310 /NCGR_PEP_ID=MMETSP1066-20121228/13318_1 /TAXON_ID=671091 /ORGANISM="Coscinodiscus wailesii, Strain CCMP2513" /LENGTH=89 /DNA_ID=CAMNT_0013250503 /DNA_START=73 /DNA_END=343 /DNA_ORIENTATION=-
MTTHKEIDAEVTFTCMSPSEYRETLVLEKLVRLHDFNDTSDNERDQRERELLLIVEEDKMVVLSVINGGAEGGGDNTVAAFDQSDISTL